jgi:cytochrome c556
MLYTRSKKSLAIGFFVSILTSGMVMAASTSATDTIKARQQSLKDTGAAMKVIRDELKGTPDVEKIKAASATIQKTSEDIGNWFPKGSGPEAGVKTGAKPEIWSDADGFSAARHAFAEQAAKLADAAKTGNAESIGAAFKSVGKSCGGCHEKFRVKED